MQAFSQFRPLGPLPWILPKLGTSSSWTVIGTISAEDRCLMSAEQIVSISPRSEVRFLRIAPMSGTAGDWFDRNIQKIEANVRRVQQSFGSASISYSSELDAIDHDVIHLADEIVEACGSHVVLDVSTMPKRFFFPLLTRLVESSHVTTLIATNTSPLAYGKELARNADDWRTLPIYCGNSRDESPEATVIIGVGYHSLKIHDVLVQYRDRRVGIKLFLPFPSLHPGFIENWKFIHEIKSEWDRVLREPIDIVRVPNHDVSLAFDCLRQHSSEGRTASLVLAPFGPKPLSLAMCLLGIARTAIGCSTEIGYTQPQEYSPDYSKGSKDVTAFCVKLNGRDLYTL